MDDAPPPETDLTALSASLQTDASDSAVFFRVLCSTLESALPSNTVVERERSVFKSKRLARMVTVRLGTETFTAELTGGRLVCRRVHAVAGIGGGLPYSREVTVKEWTDALLAAVAQEAAADSAATAALRSLSS